MKTIRFYLMMVILLISGVAYAQSFEEYRKSQQDAMKKFAQDEQKGISRLQKEYADFVLKRDKEWSDFLKKEWENYQSFTGRKLPQKPKPVEVPTYIPPLVDPGVPDVPVADVQPEIVLDLPLVPVDIAPEIPGPVEPLRKPAEASKLTMKTDVEFYGRTIQVNHEPTLTNLRFQTVNQNNIGLFWENVSNTNYANCIESLIETSRDLNLNDFGFYILLNKFTEKLYPSNKNLSTLLNWFILLKSGYSVRIAYQENTLALLIPSLQQIYQTSYLSFQGINYYIFPNLPGGQFYTYDQDYSQSGKLFDMNVSSPFNLSGKKSNKLIDFAFEGKEYKIDIQYDGDYITFLNEYPLVDLDVYFNAATSSIARESLAEALKPLMINMDELTKVNFLLHFVQTTFAYKTDPEQFGREKFFFAEELFYYPYSDCEDRSVLFSWLVREIVGLKVIGLEYTDHISTAVQFNTIVEGDYLLYGGSRYVIADPTYINAPVGMTMPQYASVVPIVRLLNNKTNEDINIEAVWQHANNSGLNKGSIRKNSKILKDGSIVITGFYANTTTIDNISLEGDGDKHQCFVARFNPAGKAIWVKTFRADQNAVGMSVETDKNGNIVLAGVFTGNLQFGTQSINAQSGKADLFLAGLAPNGEINWLNKGGLDELEAGKSTAFSAIYALNGVRQSLKHCEDEPGENSKGLFTDASGTIMYTGMVNHALALGGNEKNVSFASSSAVEIADLLKLESEKFVAKQTDPSIAGLLAAIRLVRYMDVSLTGKQIQQSLDINNPTFKKKCPNIYSNLGKINFVKNSKGVITIQTEGGGDIGFDKVKITNKSTVSISELQNGDYKMEVLSGVKVGKMVVWYHLNYVRMISRKGDLLFDYASDHSQATVNVRKDILN